MSPGENGSAAVAIAMPTLNSTGPRTAVDHGKDVRRIRTHHLAGSSERSSRSRLAVSRAALSRRICMSAEVQTLAPLCCIACPPVQRRRGFGSLSPVPERVVRTTAVAPMFARMSRAWIARRTRAKRRPRSWSDAPRRRCPRESAPHEAPPNILPSNTHALPDPAHGAEGNPPAVEFKPIVRDVFVRSRT